MGPPRHRCQQRRGELSGADVGDLSNGFKAIVDIDLLGTYNVTRAAFDLWLRDHGGCLVNITAPFEQRGVVLQAHVAAAKSGVDSLARAPALSNGVPMVCEPTRSLPVHRCRRGVTSIFRCGTSLPDRPTNPLGRHGYGVDIAHLALFLCSPTRPGSSQVRSSWSTVLDRSTCPPAARPDLRSGAVATHESEWHDDR